MDRAIIKRLEHELSAATNSVINISDVIEKDEDGSVIGIHLSNKLLNVIPKTIFMFKNLITLHLDNNSISDIHRNIDRLSSLTFLNLSNNKISSVPKEIGNLKELNTLILQNNNIVDLPRDIIKLAKLRILLTEGNPLQNPPIEIMKKGIDATFAYIRCLSPGNVEQVINEAKLIVVGQGDVGKTCLVKRLIYDTYQKEKSTEGIDIYRWRFIAPDTTNHEVQLNVWDFGGQEIYHSTHQFFLTKRSIYLLAWNARKSRDYESLYYWLNTIESFGSNSPILLVMSKCNERDDDLNMEDLKNKFPSIVGHYKVDCEDGTGIEKLRMDIRRIAWKLPHMKTTWPCSWLNVRELLELNGREWIDYSEFKSICRKEGLDKAQTDILNSYLHDLGVIIHYKEKLSLKNIVILAPEWATRAVYKVLDGNVIRERDGVLLHSDLDIIWDDDIYPEYVHPILLSLMNKFELAYELAGKDSHLIAELLPLKDPNIDLGHHRLVFYYRYDFIPAGVMTRFIVLMHNLLAVDNDDKSICWREGAVLFKDDTYAHIKQKNIDKLIEIQLFGRKKRELLSIIRNQFDYIHDSFENISITQEVPCNCSDKCQYKFNYLKLIAAEEKNKHTVECQDTWNNVELSTLLDGYQTKESRAGSIKKVGSGTYITPRYKQPSINGPSGDIYIAVSTNLYNSINIDDNIKTTVYDKLSTVRKNIEESNCNNKSDYLEVVDDAMTEITKVNPTTDKLNSLLTILGTTIQTVANIEPAMKAINNLLKPFGINIPGL
jgi:small GTP-binding protein